MAVFICISVTDEHKIGGKILKKIGFKRKKGKKVFP
jgi:hypothetical protein